MREIWVVEGQTVDGDWIPWSEHHKESDADKEIDLADYKEFWRKVRYTPAETEKP